MNPYERLAQAIIQQAAFDYKTALIHKKLHPEKPQTGMLKECERFFLSEWFLALTNVDGEMIMEKIKGEVNESFVNSSNTKSRKPYFRHRVNML